MTSVHGAVHVAFGRGEGGRYRPAQARGLIAVGDTAVGMVSAGVVVSQLGCRA